MTGKPLEKSIILKRVNGIQAEIAQLEKLARTPIEQFTQESIEFRLAQYHLHRTLEGVFHISAHILSRIPGAQATEYKELARKLGEYGIVDKNFANTKLVEMAKYRNRLVHFYAEVTPQEVHEILEKDLGDFDIFLSSIKNLLASPQKFNLSAE